MAPSVKEQKPTVVSFSNYQYTFTKDGLEITLEMIRSAIQLGEEVTVTLTLCLPTQNGLLHPKLVDERKPLCGEFLFPRWGRLVNNLRSKVYPKIVYESGLTREQLDQDCKTRLNSAALILLRK